MYCENCGSDHIVGHVIWDEYGKAVAIDYECQVCYTAWKSQDMDYLEDKADNCPDGEFE